MGVPADYYPLVMHVIELIGQGRTQTAACDETGLSVSTFKQYVERTPELHALFNDAETRGYDGMADSLVEIDTHCAIAGVSDPKVMKVLSDNIRWYLSRKRPQQYGERIVVENKITADKAIIDALSRGAERALTARVINDVAYEVIQALPPPDEDDLSQFV